MAEFLDKLKGKIDKGISKVNVKSKELIEKQKTRLQISELEAERKNVVQELGNITFVMIEHTDGEIDLYSTETTKIKKSKQLKPDKWEQAVLSVLSDICSGKLDKILFENTDKAFKITAKSLSAEVQKSIPKSEQKGQNLQWLGRVLGKFGIASRKFSKRINRERETVYEFEKEKTLTALNMVKAPNIKTDRKGQSQNYREQILSKCAEIRKLDSRIAKLEQQLKQIGA